MVSRCISWRTRATKRSRTCSNARWVRCVRDSIADARCCRRRSGKSGRGGRNRGRQPASGGRRMTQLSRTNCEEAFRRPRRLSRSPADPGGNEIIEEHLEICAGAPGSSTSRRVCCMGSSGSCGSSMRRPGSCPGFCPSSPHPRSRLTGRRAARSASISRGATPNPSRKSSGSSARAVPERLQIDRGRAGITQRIEAQRLGQILASGEHSLGKVGLAQHGLGQRDSAQGCRGQLGSFRLAPRKSESKMIAPASMA